MPVYEYRCSDCKEISEFLVNLRDVDFKPRCPECGSKDLKRLISRSSFALKGGGWYKDGYSKGK